MRQSIKDACKVILGDDPDKAKEAFAQWLKTTTPIESMDKGADEFFYAGYEFRQDEIDALKARLDEVTQRERDLMLKLWRIRRETE